MKNNDEYVLKFDEITKHFPGTTALKDVSFNVKNGEILGLVGENGAGKSTILKILSGVYKNFKGNIYKKGELLQGDINERLHMGVAMVYQGLNLCLELTVEENIFLGSEIYKEGSLGLVDHKKQKIKARNLLDRVGIKLDLTKKLKEYNIDKRQLVAIIRAISKNADVLVLDEPTSSLTDDEVDLLLKIIRSLNSEGVSFIFVSHFLDEVLEISDRVAVLKDGKLVGVKNSKDLNTDSLQKIMLGMEAENEDKDEGEEYSKFKIKESYINKKPILKVSNLSKKDMFSNVSFDLYENEIFGIAGLAGAGRTELLKSIFGALSCNEGNIYYKGEKVRFNSPAEAIKNGIVYFSEDRLNEGILEKMSVADNILVENLKKVSKKGIINKSIKNKYAYKYIDVFNIKTTGPNQLIVSLSGGNQQKVLFARLLNTNCNILLLDEPTRGIDVMAKQEIYGLVNNFIKEEGGNRAVIIVSSEIHELVSISNRILIMKEGKQKEIVKENMTKYNIIKKIS